MEDDNFLVMGSDGLGLEMGGNPEEPSCSAMEMDASGMASPKNEIAVFTPEKGEASDVVFSREAPLVSTQPVISGACPCGAKKLKSRMVSAESEVSQNKEIGHEKKLSRQDRIELGHMFQGAVSTHDWELAESLVLLADPQTLNDALCISLDSIWFLSTQLELLGITGLIKKIVDSGAYDFTRAALRTSFLASCVSACQSRTMNLADTVALMAQR